MFIRLQKKGAEGIIEPFYDGGESYKENEKFSSFLAHYRVDPKGAAGQSWMSVNVNVTPNSTVTLERDCDIDVGRFDEISLRAKIVEGTSVKMLINGEEVINEAGKGDTCNYYGKLKDSRITSIRLEITNNNEQTEGDVLFYIGVRDSKFLSDEELYMPATTPDWEGCFAENPVIEPCTEAFVDKADAEALRAKLKTGIMAKTYEGTKKYAESFMNVVPEKYIGEYIIDHDGVQAYIAACTLSFVGFIEKDLEMLKMGARFALSIAACDNWCNFWGIEMLPATTWHHRSFNESYMAFGVAMTLEFAGSIMTWHGRNILYDALIQKGLPRMDADFKTMEYIYHMNQGLAFSTGYVYALMVLAKQYPRYGKRILEIEEDVHEMFKGSILPDGGMKEGPNYWDYTMQMYVNTISAFARYHKMSLNEYAGDKLEPSSQFGLIMVNDKNQMRTVGDSKRWQYSFMTSYYLAAITENPKWMEIAEGAREAAEKNGTGGLFITYLIFGSDKKFDAKGTPAADEIFVTLPDTGYTYLKRGDDEFFGISGSSFSHCHPDKGSFMLDFKNEPALIDRGMCGYFEGVADKLSESRAHNMAVPVVDGLVMCQNAQHGYGATMVKSEYKDGVFTWISDNDNVWNKSLVTKNVRTIVSDKPFEYIITDEFEFTKPCKVLVNFNMYDNKNVKMEPVGWTPEKSEYVEHYCDFAKTPVMQQRFRSEEGTSFKLVTKVTLTD